MAVRKKTPLRVLVTGGPTRAYLDRVRFLSNFSTGELAYQISHQLCRRGIDVVVVAGPTEQPFASLPLNQYIPVETNQEMRQAVVKTCRRFKPHFGIFAAAVLDFEPVKIAEGKTSSQTKIWNLCLKPTPKIIDEVSEKFPRLRRIGFKLEWKKVRSQIRDKMAEKNMRDKNLEVLCLNFLSEIKKGKHPAYLYTSQGQRAGLSTKEDIASWITDYIVRS